MRRRRKNLNPKIIEKQHKDLSEKCLIVLKNIVKRKWINFFFFTNQERKYYVLDGFGLDLVCSFNPGRNGEVGSLCLQEKRSWQGVKGHFLRYKCVPVYLLKLGDSAAQVEYVYLIVLREAESYNFGHKEEIEKRIAKLENMIRKGKNLVNKHEKRFWLNFLSLQK